MADNKNGNNCLYNLIYTNFNEDFSKGPTFYYDLQYPSFFNFNNGYFYTNPNYLNKGNEPHQHFAGGAGRARADYAALP